MKSYTILTNPRLQISPTQIQTTITHNNQINNLKSTIFKMRTKRAQTKAIIKMIHIVYKALTLKQSTIMMLIKNWIRKRMEAMMKAKLTSYSQKNTMNWITKQAEIKSKARKSMMKWIERSTKLPVISYKKTPINKWWPQCFTIPIVKTPISIIHISPPI